MMQSHSPEIEIIQNLLDAGCSTELISKFMEQLKSKDTKSGLRLLAGHRNSLLDNLHKIQKQIDCLDYLVYQMEKQERQAKRA